MSPKKSISSFVLLFVVCLCLFDLIAQTIRKAYPAQTAVSAVESEESSISIPLLDQVDMVEFEGQAVVSAEQIPWGINCGTVTDETLGSCIFLTPNTALTFSYVPSAGQTLALDMEIYPSLQQISDGCSLQVQISDEKQTLLSDSTLQISNTAQIQHFEIDLSAYDGQQLSLRLVCGNGTKDTDDGDWLFITYCEIR